MDKEFYCRIKDMPEGSLLVCKVIYSKGNHYFATYLREEKYSAAQAEITYVFRHARCIG